MILGYDGYGRAIKKVIWSSKDTVSREDFIAYPWIRNNFYAYFLNAPNSFIAPIYQASPHLERFKKEQPSLFNKLYREEWNFKDQKTMDLLYSAYIFMIEYDMIVTNHDLFM